MLKLFSESNVSFYAEDSSIVSKKDSVFYNPSAKHSRDLTLLVSKAIKPKVVYDLNAGSGIMSLRIANALNLKKLVLYDINSFAIEIINKNVKLNNIKNAITKNEDSRDANVSDADLILIDPFGSPSNIYSEIIKTSKVGAVIGLKATDLGVLTGTYPKKARKAYNLTIYKNPCPRELAIRSLLLFAELEANKHNKSIKPLFSYATNYYVHCFFKITKRKKQKQSVLNYCDRCLNTEISTKKDLCICENKYKHTDFINIPKSDNSFIKKLIAQRKEIDNNKEVIKELERASNQTLLKKVYNVPKLYKKLKSKIPKRKELEKQGFVFLPYDKDTATCNKKMF